MSWRFGTAALFFLNPVPSGSIPSYEPPVVVLEFQGTDCSADPLDAGVSWDPSPDPKIIQIAQLLSDRMPGRQDWNDMAEIIVKESQAVKLDPLFILAVMEEESGFNPKALSPVGAHGLMQLMPATFAITMGHEGDSDPIENVKAGIRYLGKMKRMFREEDYFLIAYNAGPGTVKDYLEDGEVPERYFEYPHEVDRRYHKFRRLLASR
ncbi:MAG: lytic transglycosylase domain-containing protein [Acidiferrobacterales bacterium]